MRHALKSNDSLTASSNNLKTIKPSIYSNYRPSDCQYSLAMKNQLGYLPNSVIQFSTKLTQYGGSAWSSDRRYWLLEIPLPTMIVRVINWLVLMHVFRRESGVQGQPCRTSIGRTRCGRLLWALAAAPLKCSGWADTAHSVVVVNAWPPSTGGGKGKTVTERR